jgi:hypothetical protein
MVHHITAADANTVLKKIAESNHQWLGGNLPAIRKKPHVIDVALKQSIQLNC